MGHVPISTPKKVGQAEIYSIFNNFWQFLVLTKKRHEAFPKT